jgi:hypothetical protein
MEGVRASLLNLHQWGVPRDLRRLIVKRYLNVCDVGRRQRVSV